MHQLCRLIRTASFRFAALYVLLFAASAGILGVAIFLIARSSLEQQLTSSVQADSSFLQSEYRRGGLAHLQSLIQSRERQPQAPDYLLQAPDGRVLAGEITPRPALKPGWTELTATEAGLDAESPERLRALVVDLGGGFLLVTGDDLGRIAEMEEAIAGAFLWVVGLAVALGIGGGVLLSRAFLLRLDAISRTAEAIIAGEFSQRMPISGDSDFDRLSLTLNRMLDRIDNLMDALRQVSADIAHDLRTPLTRLYQKLETARDKAHSLADYEMAVSGALADAEALLDTFSALLRITQVEGASRRAAFRDVDLSSVVDAVLDAYRPDSEDAGHRLEGMVTPGITMYGDHDLLTQALANLVENGLRHTLPGTRLRVELTRDGALSRLSVEDDGPGVSAADLPHLTQRFYRTERSRTTPGNGLGLSLAAAVAELHGGQLRLQQLAPGLRVILEFPLHP